MAPVFASADIAALVAAFPPPSPIKGHPSLVRSQSRNSLLDSQKPLARFRVLLGTSSTRIQRADLPRRLGIEKNDWLFDCYDHPLHFSKDKLSIIPVTEYCIIYKKLQAQLQEGNFVQLSLFATEENVSLESVDQWIVEQDSPALLQLSTDSRIDNVFLGTQKIVDNTKHRIMLATIGPAVTRVNLSDSLADIPKAILRVLTTKVIEHATNIKGSIEDEGDAIVFVSSTYGAAQDSKRKEAPESSVQSLVQHFVMNGYCIIEEQSEKALDIGSNTDERVRRAILFRYPTLSHEGSLVLLNTRISSSPAKFAVSKQKLSQTIEELQGAVNTLVARRSESDTYFAAFNSAIQEKLIGEAPQIELASLILNSAERKTVEAHFDLVVSNMEAADRDCFVQMAQESVMGPLHLYGVGLTIIGDSTLRQHQEEYLGEHFRRDVVPRFIEALKEQRLLRNKARGRETEKMAQSCTQAKTFSEMQSVLSKFSRKQKVDPPSSDRLAKIQQSTLKSKVQAMHNMTRGSDILQNLLWTMLARSSGGLFVSSGKDTSRMVKLYKTIGAAEVVMKLEGWRDLLKAGDECAEDLQEMRDLGIRAVEEIGQDR